MRPGYILSFGLGIAVTVFALWLLIGGVDGLNYVIVGTITAALLAVLAAVGIRIWMFLRFEVESTDTPTSISELLWIRRKELAATFALVFLLGVTAEIVLIVEAMTLFLQTDRMRVQNDLLERQEILLIANTEAEYTRALSEARLQLAPFEVVSAAWSEFGIDETNPDPISAILCTEESFDCGQTESGGLIMASHNWDDLELARAAYLGAFVKVAVERGRRAELWDYSTPDETGWAPYRTPTEGSAGERFFRLAEVVCEVPAPTIRDGLEAVHVLVEIERVADEKLSGLQPNTESPADNSDFLIAGYIERARWPFETVMNPSENDAAPQFISIVDEYWPDYSEVHKAYERSRRTLIDINDFCERRRSPLDEVAMYLKNELASVRAPK